MTQQSGWYDDPWDADAYRYWDGAKWTAHHSPKYTDGVRDQPAYASASAGASTTDGERLAGWWQRVGARILDNVIVLAISSPLTAYFGYRFYQANEDLFRDQFFHNEGMDSAFTQSASGLGWSALVTVALVVVGGVYESACLRRWGRTPGKRAAGIAVRGRSGSSLSWAVIARRVGLLQGLYLASLVPVLGLLATLAVLLDYLWPLWDGRKQSLHDKAADTVVVRH